MSKPANNYCEPVNTEVGNPWVYFVRESQNNMRLSYQSENDCAALFTQPTMVHGKMAVVGEQSGIDL